MIERLNPREFERHLSERLLAARQPRNDEQALLEIESGADDLPGGRHWLVDAIQAGEIAPLPPLLPVPLTRAWFAGVANIRGTLYSVVDFAAWRGGAPTPRTAQTRLLLIGGGDGNHHALLVERALGLRTPDQLHTVSAESESGQTLRALDVNAAWRSTVLVAADDSARWTRLDIPMLLAMPGYLDIALPA
jgi:twitching motility protein PilI